jgi:hypothetical protein
MGDQPIVNNITGDRKRQSMRQDSLDGGLVYRKVSQHNEIPGDSACDRTLWMGDKPTANNITGNRKRQSMRQDSLGGGLVYRKASTVLRQQVKAHMIQIVYQAIAKLGQGLRQDSLDGVKASTITRKNGDIACRKSP